MAGGRRRSDESADGPLADSEQVARSIVLARLTDQPRSRAELAAFLARRQVPEQVAGRVLNRLAQVGLVDDAAFAASWVGSRHRGRGLGRRALAHELRRKGVADDTARAALKAVDDDAERAAARRLVERRLASVRRLEPATARRRLVALLARRGYGPGIAATVVADLLDDAAADPALEPDCDGEDASVSPG